LNWGILGGCQERHPYLWGLWKFELPLGLERLTMTRQGK